MACGYFVSNARLSLGIGALPTFARAPLVYSKDLTPIFTHLTAAPRSSSDSGESRRGSLFE